MHLMNHGFHNFTSRWWHYGLVISLICMTAAAIYSNTFQSPFVFDDQHSIQENVKIRDLRNFFTLDVLQSPRPLVDFTFALNYHFGKLRVFGYHLVNLLIHIANGILVFFLSRMLFRKLSGADKPNCELAALFAALIFIAHPLQTQAVTYIVQRYTAMAAFFYLGSVLSYIIARDAKSAGKAVAGWGFFLIAFVCGLLAFLSKQNSASLPLAILLVEYAVYDRTWQGWKKKIGFILPGVLLCGFFYAYNMGLFRHDIQLGTFLEDVSEVARETQQVSRWHYLCTQFNVIAVYIRLLVIPIQQNLDYLYPFKKGFFDGATPYLFVFLLGIFVAAWWNRNKRPILFVGIFLFFITLSVESSFFPIRDALFEHRLYLPMFGFSLLSGYVAVKLLSKYRLWSVVAASTMVMALAVATYLRNEVWRDDVILWSDVITKSPHNYRGLTNIGYAFKQRGNLNAAIANYDRALQLKPDYYFALSNKGAVIGRMGKPDEAILLFKKALQYKPDYSLALNNLGVALASKGETDDAAACFLKALAINPDYLDAHVNLATALFSMEKYEQSLQQYNEALRIQPDSADLHSKTGVIFHYLNRYPEAIRHYNEALRLDSQNVGVYLNKGNSLLASGMIVEAVESYKEAVRLDPALLEGHINMGVAYQRMGNLEAAAQQFREVLKIDSNSIEAHANLGSVLYSQGKRTEALQQLGLALQLKPDSEEIKNNISFILQNALINR
ncbi:MAG: tetratricopeptide repeat protein [Pseudomonadota bacterium]